MSDKVDMPLSKGEKGLGEQFKVGDMRAHKDRDKNEFHVHDDVGKMVFRQAGITQFEIAAKAFLSSPRYREGATVLFPGLTSDPGNGRKACDLILVRERARWQSRLVECGTFAPDIVQIVDPVISDLHEAVYGNTDKIGDLTFVKNPKNDEVKVTHLGVSFVMRRSAVRSPPNCGIRRFELAVDRFLSSVGQYRGTVSILIPGDGTGSDDNCDLVLTLPYGHWSAGLFKRGEFQADVVIGCDVLNDLDEIVQS